MTAHEAQPGRIRANRYEQIVEHIFHSRYAEGMSEVAFERDDLERAAAHLKVRAPKNLGDILYSFRYRATLPESIRLTAPEGMEWVIRSSGRARYSFVLGKIVTITPNPLLATIKVPDATPGIIAMYALSDEQALLARLRYNRLIDLFTGVTCYSLQNHLRTTVGGIGQVETDELYIGIDQRGAQYVVPVQAKGGNDRLGIVQIEQDVALCDEKFPSLICRPVAAQFIADNTICLFEFQKSEQGIALYTEKHYKLVPKEEIAPGDLDEYRAHVTR